MVVRSGRAAWVGGAVALAALALAPTLAANQTRGAKPRRAYNAVSLLGASQLGVGTFTPSAADPRLAAAFARGSLTGGGFRFTPSAAPGTRRAVTVAVRARSTPRAATLRGAESVQATASAPTAVMPTAYNLGVSVGWKRFALSGDIAKVDSGAFPGGRESMDVGLSYSGKKWSTRVAVGADRVAGPQAPALISGERGYSADLSGSFALTKDVDLTGGVRYRLQRDRLQPLDDRRDSQAIYIGTAFRF